MYFPYGPPIILLLIPSIYSELHQSSPLNNFKPNVGNATYTQYLSPTTLHIFPHSPKSPLSSQNPKKNTNKFITQPHI